MIDCFEKTSIEEMINIMLELYDGEDILFNLLFYMMMFLEINHERYNITKLDENYTVDEKLENYLVDIQKVECE